MDRKKINPKTRPAPLDLTRNSNKQEEDLADIEVSSPGSSFDDENFELERDPQNVPKKQQT
jgi:hypothetical protein